MRDMLTQYSIDVSISMLLFDQQYSSLRFYSYGDTLFTAYHLTARTFKQTQINA